MRPRRLGPAVLAFSILNACAAIVGLDRVGYGEDDAGADGGGPGTDAEAQDGGGDRSVKDGEAGVRFGACADAAPIFEEDFSAFDAANAKRWSVDLSGSCDGTPVPTLGNGGPDDPYVELKAGVSTGECFHVLSTALGIISARAHLEVEFLVKVDLDAAPHTFAQGVFWRGNEENIRLRLEPAGLTVRAGDGLPVIGAPVPLDGGGFHRVELQLSVGNADAGSVRLVVDGAEQSGLMISLKPPATTPQLRLQIGPYFDNGAGATTDRYDSIKIWSCD